MKVDGQPSDFCNDGVRLVSHDGTNLRHEFIKNESSYAGDETYFFMAIKSSGCQFAESGEAFIGTLKDGKIKLITSSGLLIVL